MTINGLDFLSLKGLNKFLTKQKLHNYSKFVTKCTLGHPRVKGGKEIRT